MRRVLFTCVVWFVGSGCICGGCVGCPETFGYKTVKEYRDAESAHRQKKAQPVIDALEAYKARHAKYPEQIDELVTAGFLDAIPNMANDVDHQGESGRISLSQRLHYARVGNGYQLRTEFTFFNSPRITSEVYKIEYTPEAGAWRKKDFWGVGGIQSVPPTKR